MIKNNGKFMMIKYCSEEAMLIMMLLFQDNVYGFTYLHPCSEISLLEIKRAN